MQTSRSRNKGVSSGPALSVLHAPAHWQRIDFIADLHLQESQRPTFELWQRYMQTTSAHAVVILGDLFEVWVGDDIADQPPENLRQKPDFEIQCASVLRAAAQRLDLYFMHGNRDFLLGPVFAKACGMTLLNDPCILELNGENWLLSHGDALCLDDLDYMRFRTTVRSTPWQQDFLSQPLSQRQAVARELRQQSESRKSGAAPTLDLDVSATCGWLHKAQATTLIHGHTHRPAEHLLRDRLRRLVLSDWDASATPVRAEVLRLIYINGTSSIRRLTPAMAASVSI